MRDITERYEAEAAQQRALIDAERANQAKSEFLTTMSHELRTPLNAILGFADILRQQYLGPIGENRYIEYASDIETSGQHLLDLVNDLLDLAKIESGKHELRKEAVPVGDIVVECAHIIAKHADLKEIEITTKVSDGLADLDADRRAAKQILLNLLSNAVKFTPKGGNVAVTVEACECGNAIRVIDNGLGIPADSIPGLTDPFERAAPNPYVTHVTQEGTGLGLSITKSLVELHNGKFGIESEIGNGTTVTVELPVVS